ncbi:MAG: hypothetical protein R3A12_14670 [Ignavibacteria bacterium]
MNLISKDEDFQKCIELKKETYVKGKSFRNEITDILKIQNTNLDLLKNI